MIKLDAESVLRAMPGVKYLVDNPETGKEEVVLCFDCKSLGDHKIFFTREGCPDFHGNESVPYEDVIQHIRPIAVEGTKAVNTRAEFSDMLARRAYRIA